MLDNGLQAIVIKPSAPFPFLRLPAHLHARILGLKLTPTTNKGRIEFVTKGKSGSVRAKDYLKESKHRTAMATLNKQGSPTVFNKGRIEFLTGGKSGSVRAKDYWRPLDQQQLHR
jgi:hypothetical protein